MSGDGTDPWGRLAESAGVGELWLANGAGAQCVKVCEEFITELDRRAESIRDLSNVGGFGGFVSARQLEAGFQRKALEAHGRILEYKAAVERMRDTFAAADAAYRTADEDTRQAVVRAGEGPRG